MAVDKLSGLKEGARAKGLLVGEFSRRPACRVQPFFGAGQAASFKWQALNWPGAISRRSGRSALQRGIAWGHRG